MLSVPFCGVPMVTPPAATEPPAGNCCAKDVKGDAKTSSNDKKKAGNVKACSNHKTEATNLRAQRRALRPTLAARVDPSRSVRQYFT